MSSEVNINILLWTPQSVIYDSIFSNYRPLYVGPFVKFLWCNMWRMLLKAEPPQSQA